MFKKEKEKEVFPSITYSIQTGCGTMYIHILYPNKEYKKIKMIKVTLGKQGGCASSHLEAKCAFVNALLRNVSNADAIKTLTDACGHQCKNIELTCHDMFFRAIIEELMKEKA